ncbi:MAG: VWA-like domain-containing protein, partial [Agathobacter sp.]
YSTSGELISNFLKETFSILTEADSFFTKSRVHIIQCDNQVQMDEEIHCEAEIEALMNRFTIVGGGGTDFRPAFSYVDELIESKKLKDLSGLLYFTDGKGIYPKKRPSYKTAFLFLEDYEEENVPAWAIRLRLLPEEFGGAK